MDDVLNVAFMFGAHEKNASLRAVCDDYKWSRECWENVLNVDIFKTQLK